MIRVIFTAKYTKVYPTDHSHQSFLKKDITPFDFRSLDSIVLEYSKQTIQMDDLHQVIFQIQNYSPHSPLLSRVISW